MNTTTLLHCPAEPIPLQALASALPWLRGTHPSPLPSAATAMAALLRVVATLLQVLSHYERDGHGVAVTVNRRLSPFPVSLLNHSGRAEESL